MVRHLKVNSRLRGSNVPPQTTDEEAEFFSSEGVPETVIGFVSSALLNLSNSKYQNSFPKFRYVKKKIYGSKFDRYYYDFFEENNILDSHLYI